MKSAINCRKKELRLNSIFGLAYQFVLIISGLVLPRYQLQYYGSEINGLVSSITQFLSLISICDLGIGAVVTSSYYKPLAQNDILKISKIYAYSKKYFRVISLILIVYVIVLFFIYPVISDSQFGFCYISSLILVMCISQFGQYYIGINEQLLLSADRKLYIYYVINGISLIINSVISIVLMMLGLGIHAVMLSTSLIYLFRPFLMWCYVRRNYNILYDVKSDGNEVPQKKSGIIQHLSNMTYENTDIVLLTIFTDLSSVSVYSVYTLVTRSIRQIILSSLSGFQSLFGNLFANDEKIMISELYQRYHWIFHTINTVLFTITGVMIVPFVELYTSNVNDVDYKFPVFALLVTIAYYLSCIRLCDYVLIKAIGHYKQTEHASLIEALINIIMSVVLVFKYGFVGVIIGTILATMYFVIFEAVYFSKKLFIITIKNVIKQFLVDAFIMSVVWVTTFNNYIFDGTIISWIVYAIITSLITITISLVIQVLFYKKYIIQLFKSEKYI